MDNSEGFASWLHDVFPEVRTRLPDKKKGREEREEKNDDETAEIWKNRLTLSSILMHIIYNTGFKAFV